MLVNLLPKMGLRKSPYLKFRRARPQCVVLHTLVLMHYWYFRVYVQSRNDCITKCCQKLTKLTNLVPRRVFSKSVEGVFDFTILFVLCHFNHKEVPPKKGVFDYIFVVSPDIIYAKHPLTASSQELKPSCNKNMPG